MFTVLLNYNYILSCCQSLSNLSNDCLCLLVFVCVYVSLTVSMCLFACMFVFLCLCMCMYMPLCVC